WKCGSSQSEKCSGGRMTGILSWKVVRFHSDRVPFHLDLVRGRKSSAVLPRRTLRLRNFRSMSQPLASPQLLLQTRKNGSKLLLEEGFQGFLSAGTSVSTRWGSQVQVLLRPLEVKAAAS